MDDQDFVAILDKTISNPNTRKNYKYRLSGLQKRLRQHMSETGMKVKEDQLILHVLTHPRQYFPIIKTIYNNETLTVKNIVTFLLSLVKHANLKCKIESPYKKWLSFHEEMAKLENERYSTNLPTDKQRQNYVSVEELQRAVDKLAKESPHGTIKKSLQFCLLKMYTYIKPKRADFGAIRVYAGKDPHKKDRNYVVLSNDKSYFVLNHYNKTQTNDIPIVEEIDKELVKTFRDSVLAHPRQYLFVGADQKHFKTSDAFGKFVKTTFKEHLGKSTGVSLLRHMFINEKVDLNNLSIMEKNAIATAMGHTRSQQEQYKLFFGKTSKDVVDSA